ncbi:MAG: flagellar motor switch protein FliG [Chthoniobacterales bacterium]|nr:flagellar motor switch protein FliG [Chthoniobacterales bacterium]
MTESEYQSLSKYQKLAAFLITIGEEQASHILRQLTDEEIEKVVKEIAKFETVDFELQEMVMEEFCSLVGKGLSSSLGGVPFAQRSLERAKGPHIASNIMLRALPASSSIDAVRELDEMDTRQIFSIIKEEQPQTISFLFSYLEPKKIATILPLFPPQRREEIVERLGTMEPISSEHIGKVLKCLSKRIAVGPQKHAVHRRGGVKTVAQLLNALDRETSKALLARIEERNAPLAQAIRKNLFSMEDIARLPVTDIQKILREVESSDLCMALKTAPESVKKAIFSALSKRAGEALKEEMEMLGPVRVSDIEQAQDRIVAIVSNLADAGEINITFDTDDIVS